jgi:SAM-dependent methyltransferase
LEHDRQVARSENLEITTVEGDMTDLSTFPGGRFDLVFNPVSNLYIPDVHPLWQETYRVLRPGGCLLTGFMNPCFYVFYSKFTGW